MSSLVGVWNGVSLMLADFVGHVRGHDADHPWPAGRADPGVRRAGRVLHAVPVGDPALDPEHRPGASSVANKLPSNIALVLCTLTFGALAVNEIAKVLELL